MTGSYLAGVARRASPGRAALLPPVTPWGIEPRPVAARPVVPEPVSPIPAPAAAAPERPPPARRPSKRPVGSKRPEAKPAVAETVVAPRPAHSPRLFEPLMPPRQATAEPPDDIESAPFEAARIETAEPAQSAAEVPAPPGPVPDRRVARKQRIEARSHEQAVVPEPADHRATPRTAKPRAQVPPVRIESIEVVVERPQAPAPAPPPRERPQAPPAAPAPPPALARGFSSLIGLRQG